MLTQTKPLSPEAEAWNSGRPIFSRLPGENEIFNQPGSLSDWLTAFFDQHFVDLKAAVDAIPPKQLNPLTADEEWLDFTSALYGWTDDYWKPSWSIETKRILLANSYTGQAVWKTKGSLSTISFILSAVGIRNIVSNRSDFIIGTSEVGDPVGIDPWAYRVYLPPSYQNQPQESEVMRLLRLWGPAWCDYDIVFDTERFDIDYILADEQGRSITTEDGESLLMSTEDG